MENKELQEFKTQLKKFRPLDDFNLSINGTNLLMTTKIKEDDLYTNEKNITFNVDPNDLREMLYDVVMYSFNFGYIQGYRHVKNYGLEPTRDDFGEIDINKQIEELEQIELFKKLFNFECI